MDEVIVLLGKRLKYLRRLKSLTQAQLAEKVGLSVNYISQIETGVASPTLKTLSILAQGLDVEIKELFDFGQQASYKNERGKGSEKNRNEWTRSPGL